MTLQQIGRITGTDKGNAGSHTFEGMSYLDVYASYLDGLRESVRTVLELGVARGGSLKMWRDYFPNAQIWGVDIDPDAMLDYGPRVCTVLGSQADPAVIAQVAPGQEFDLVVDDGSHLVEHLTGSLRLIWPRIRSGGLYVMEDLAGTWNCDMTYTKVQWPGQGRNSPQTDYLNKREPFQAVVDEHIQAMDGLRGQTRFVHFWPMQCFLKKV